jgi:ABC-type polysaccharide/polyol phosphate export permease
VIDPAVIADQPPPRLSAAKPRGPIAAMAHTIQGRHQIGALTRRDFTARYKQTSLGWAWALLLPLLTIAVFTVFIQRVAHANTHGVPYVLWSFLGLFGWNFFSNAVSNGGTSLLSNQSLLNKVYSARQIYPIAGVALAGLDALISLGAFAIACVATRFVPAATVYWLPVIMVVNIVFALAVTFIVAILIVYVRDLRNIIPIALQLGLFATPVVYGLNQIPRGARLIYCFLNPIAPVVESYRRAVLYGQAPPWNYLGAGAASAVVLLFIAMWIFARFERGIVDII